MWTAIGAILPLAVGVAISYGPMMVALLLLTSQRARQNGPAFALGWLLGLTVVGGCVLALANAGHLSGRGNPALAGAALKLLLGCLLLFLAGKQWQRRPTPGEAATLPKGLAALEEFVPIKALLLGAFFAVVNPKNFVLSVSAALTIAQIGLPVSQAIGALAVFGCLASLSLVMPILFSFLVEARTTAFLVEWKTWLTANNSAVQFVLLTVLGSQLVGKAISGLAGG
jgi:threonine/homoserine/homoserine lactone efflux protein